MESKFFCAYNASRRCTLNSKITIADSARESLKVLKVLIEGLARDGESSLWLTPLVFTPNIMRLFPFDFAYLDGDLNVIEAMSLPPGIPFPGFSAQVASALIVPFETFSSTGTCSGDRIIVCLEEELEARIAEISNTMVPAAAAVFPDAPVAPTAARNNPASALPTPAPHSFQGPRVTVPVFAGSVAQGTVSTVAMSTNWQLSTSTTAAVLPEPVDTRDEASREAFALPHSAVVEAGAVEVETEDVESGSVSVADSEGESQVDSAAETHFDSELASEPVDPIVVEEDAQRELFPSTAPSVTEAIVPVPDAALTLREIHEEKLDAAKESELVEEPRKGVSSVPETAPIIGTQIETASNGRAPLEGKPQATGTATGSDLDGARKKPREKKKKESLGVLVKRFLNCEDPLPERRSIIRLLSKELIAYTANREKTKAHEVRDVSPTGLYLRTDERWKTGEIISLVLQRRDATEAAHDKRVAVKVKIVRSDEGGVGMSWIWPDGVEFQPWNRLHTKRSDETDADYFLRELRLTEALGFLRQICPSSVEEVKQALHQRLSNKRVASAVEIVLKAREMAGLRERGAEKHAHPDMVRRIIENGSWTEDNWIRQWWAGLLVSACSADGLDTSNSIFIDLLAKLTSVHLRVLSFVCPKGAELMAAGSPENKLALYFTAEEFNEAVGSHSLARIQQTMGQLSSVGLLGENSKPSYIAVTDKGKTRIDATPLALRMYARCHGIR